MWLQAQTGLGQKTKMRRRRWEGVLYTHSIPVHLRLRPQGQLAAGRCTGRRVRGTRRLCWVPPDTDVLPSSLGVKHTQVTVVYLSALLYFPSVLLFIM